MNAVLDQLETLRIIPVLTADRRGRGGARMPRAARRWAGRGRDHVPDRGGSRGDSARCRDRRVARRRRDRALRAAARARGRSRRPVRRRSGNRSDRDRRGAPRRRPVRSRRRDAVRDRAGPCARLPSGQGVPGLARRRAGLPQGGRRRLPGRPVRAHRRDQRRRTSRPTSSSRLCSPAAGTWICDTALLRDGRFDEVERRARDAVAHALLA